MLRMTWTKAAVILTVPWDGSSKALCPHFAFLVPPVTCSCRTELPSLQKQCADSKAGHSIAWVDGQRLLCVSSQSEDIKAFLPRCNKSADLQMNATRSLRDRRMTQTLTFKAPSRSVIASRCCCSLSPPPLSQ